MFAGPMAVIAGVEMAGAYALEMAVLRYSPSAKHLAGAGGRWAKFNVGTPNGVRRIVYEALRSPNRVVSIQADGRYRIVADLGRVIGTKGQTAVRVIMTPVGQIVTSLPEH